MNTPFSFTIKVSPEIREKLQSQLKPNQSITNLMSDIIRNHFDEKSIVPDTKPTEEEIIAQIYLLWTANISIGNIIESLSNSHKVSEQFIYHCYGRLVLSGALKQH